MCICKNYEYKDYCNDIHQNEFFAGGIMIYFLFLLVSAPYNENITVS